MENTEGNLECLPSAETNDNFTAYNTKLSEVGLPALSSAEELLILKKAFVEKEEWEGLLKSHQSHKAQGSIPSGFINESSHKCKWDDADLSIVVSFSGSLDMEAGTIEVSTGSDLPYYSFLVLPSELKTPDTPTQTKSYSEVNADAGTTDSITIKRAFALALGLTDQILETRGLITRQKVYNECGDVISDEWPFFTGKLARDAYRLATSNGIAIGVPMHGAIGGNEFNPLQSTGWWHTSFDPDVIRSYRSTTEWSSTAGAYEDDYEFDGNIFLGSVEKSINSARGPNNNASPQSVATRAPLQTAPPLHSAQTGPRRSRNNQYIDLICYPGITNDSINSWPIKGSPKPDYFADDTSKMTQLALSDLGYTLCNSQPSPEINICPPEPYCCRLVTSVSAAQNRFQTSITEIESGILESEKYPDTFFVERGPEQEVLALSAHNTDGLYTGIYTYSIVTAVGVSASLLTSLGRDAIYGSHSFLQSVNDITRINNSDRYLYIEGKGAGFVQVRAQDQRGCSHTITIVFDPANFSACDYIKAGMNNLQINYQNSDGLANVFINDLAVTSPQVNGGQNLDWAWDVTRRPVRTANAAAAPRGTLDTEKLELSITVSGGIPFPTNGPGSLPDGAPYKVFPLNNSVYVGRASSTDLTASNYYNPVPAAVGFEYGSTTPTFEPIPPNPLINETRNNDFKVYGNKPGDKCFFRVEDFKGCVQTLELRARCSRGTILTPSFRGVNIGQWTLLNGQREGLGDLYSASGITRGTLGVVSINIGLGETEKASLQDICAFELGRVHNTYEGSRTAPATFQPAGARPMTAVGFVLMPATAPDGKIPGLTHEVFTDKPIIPRVRKGSLYPTLRDLQRATRRNMLVLKSWDGISWRVSWKEDSSRIVKVGLFNEKMELKAVNQGWADIEYFIDDGQGGCTIDIGVLSTPPQIVYGDVIQGHTWLDVPFTETPDPFQSAAYRIEENFIWTDFMQLWDDIPVHVGRDGLNVGTLITALAAEVGAPSHRQDYALPNFLNNSGSMAFGPVFPNVGLDPLGNRTTSIRPLGTGLLPQGMAIPCGKSFFGLKIISQKGNYHEDSINFRADCGWYTGRQVRAPLRFFPHVPSRENIKRKATGWQFDIAANSNDFPNTYDLVRRIAGSGAWGTAQEMYPYLGSGDRRFLGVPVGTWRARDDGTNSGWNRCHAFGGTGDPFIAATSVFGWGTGAVGTLANPGSPVTRKSYDIIVGPIYSTDFSDVTGEKDQSLMEYDLNRIRLRPTWEPFPETVRPVDAVIDGQLSGYGWRWPQQDSTGNNALPQIKATNERWFDSPGRSTSALYLNSEATCGVLIAAANPAEFAGMPQNFRAKDDEGLARSRDQLDSGCGVEHPFDNIIINNIHKNPWIEDLVGKWIRITWEPGYNDNPDLPKHIPPAPHVTMKEWKNNDRASYDKALDGELTKCYKIMYLQRGEDFDKLEKTRKTSDGKDGFHRRNMGRVDVNLDHAGYLSCEECGEEVVITSCNNGNKYVVKSPDFKHASDDFILFDDNLRWPIHYRFIDAQGLPNTLRGCFKFEKKVAAEGVPSTEHGFAPLKMEEVEIQNFSAAIDANEAGISVARQTLISPDEFLSKLAAQQCITETMNTGSDIIDVATCGTTCEECHETIVLPEIDSKVIPSPTCPVLETTLDPDSPYGAPDSPDKPTAEDLSTEINPISSWPTCVDYNVTLSKIGDQLRVEITDLERPPHVSKMEELLYGGIQNLPFLIKVTGPGITGSGEYKREGSLSDDITIFYDVDWTTYNGALDREFLGRAQIWFAGFEGCYKEVLFDHACDVLYTSNPFIYDRDVCETPIETEYNIENCPCANSCPSCEMEVTDLTFPHIQQLYKQSGVILEVDDDAIAYIFDEDFYFIKSEILSQGENIIFLDDKEKDTDWSEYSYVETPVCTETEIRDSTTKDFRWIDSECYSPEDGFVFDTIPTPESTPKNNFIDQLPCDQNKIIEGFDKGESGEEKDIKVSGRCGFLAIKSSKQGSYEGESNKDLNGPTEFWYWCRKYDGIMFDGSTIDLVKLDKPVRGKGSEIFFGSYTEQETSAQKLSIAARLNQDPEIIKEILSEAEELDMQPEILERSLQTTSDPAAIAFGHSRSGNEDNNSPLGILGNASSGDLSSFLTQLKLKETETASTLGDPFSLSMSDYIWTSTLGSVGLDSSTPLELISDTIYENISVDSIITSNIISGAGVTGPDTADRAVSLRNDSDNTYIIEACLNPDGVKDFELCPSSSVFLPKIEAVSFESRESFNELTGNSKFFIIKANEVTLLNFKGEKMLNDDSYRTSAGDYSTNLFYRIVGGFYGNSEEDAKTYITTLDPTLTLAQFDLWALLPPSMSSAEPYQLAAGGKFLITVNESQKFDVSWNGVDYKLINIFSGLSSGAELTGLTIE